MKEEPKKEEKKAELTDEELKDVAGGFKKVDITDDYRKLFEDSDKEEGEGPTATFL